MNSKNDADGNSGSPPCYLAAERVLLGQYRIQTKGKDSELAAKDRYLAADGLIRVYDAAKKLVDAIEQADMDEGAGDRVPTEIWALAELREVLAR